MEKRQIPIIALNDRKTINGWAFYDWANSAYALVITVAIFPVYFLEVTAETILIGGWEISNSALLSFSISAAYIIIAFLLPLLSGIADYGGRRKAFLKFFTYLGSFSCLALFFFPPEGEYNWIMGIVPSMLAIIGFAGGLVFYNAYLPEIASEDQLDRVSAKGFSYGYIGSVILLVVNLIMISFPQWFGLPEGSLPARISFLMVGLWWMGFAQIPFKRLPPDRGRKGSDRMLYKGYEEINKVWRQLKLQPNTIRFLLAFFFYSAGVQTILLLAAAFAKVELDFASNEMIIMVLILQVVAIGGAYFFAWISSLRGNKFALMSMLLIWVLVCLFAYFVHQKITFYFIAVAVGLVMGGIQSLSRSTYSKLIPRETDDNTSYFSFYDLLDKVAIVLGTFSFGAIEYLTGGMRPSILALIVYFLIGIAFLIFVRIRPARLNPSARNNPDRA